MGAIHGKTTAQANMEMALRAVAKKHGCVLHSVDFEKRILDLRGNWLESIFNARDEIMSILEETDF